jgi:hypothetical protein
MAWDPALLRKYSSTNHFKLLNQVRSDLKEQPIQRNGSSAARRSPTRRRAAPAPVSVSQPVVEPAAETSFDSFVPVPVLIEAFE